MYNIIAYGKKYLLSDGQIVVVNKINVRQYYLLILCLLIYKNALIKISKVKYKTANEYLETIKENSIEYAKVKVEYNNILEILKECIDIEITKIKQEYIMEIINNVLLFNSIPFGVNGKECETEEELREDLEIKIGIVCAMIKTTPELVLEMRYYDVCVLIRENNRQRVNQINDIRLAYHGEKQDYIKYTKGLMGEVVYTGDEIFRNPEILKRMAH